MTISKMKMTRKPDFKKAYRYANEILVCTSIIDQFPFSTKQLVQEQSDIAFCSYRKAKNVANVDISQFGSDSAVLMEMLGAHIIFYNQYETATRIRYSILHEFGHFVLQHELNLSPKYDLYRVQEVEANCFAAQLLMPEQLLRQCAKRGKELSSDFIMKSFNVSWEAAEKRKRTLSLTNEEWRSYAESEYDDIILTKYKSILDRIAPLSYNSSFSFEQDYEREKERNNWMDSRSRWY